MAFFYALRPVSKSFSVSKRCFSFSRHLLSSPETFKVDNSLLMKLRKETQIQISKAREALQHSNNNYSKALEWLEKDLSTSGALKAQKVKDRAVEEGVVSVHINDSHSAASIVSLSCETDFVSRNDSFALLASKLAQTACSQIAPHFALNVGTLHDNQSVLETQVSSQNPSTVLNIINESIAKLSENIVLTCTFTQAFNPQNNFIASYVHGKTTADPNTGKICSLVSFTVDSSLHQNQDFIKLAKRIAQQVVAFKPLCLTGSDASNDQVSLLDSEFMFGGGTVRDVLLAESQKLNSQIEISSIKWVEAAK
ncbi:hypothetical protein BB561_005673 [Smittium simulii]|uniref:Elongation factor Ts, mitochondrial n=1 Tax=Smittium simulii TaxID=133385 RepID=A0A2T9Y945_9FUNG|nr:hypothetical protein BB561_005673 [Smittium simulii]